MNRKFLALLTKFHHNSFPRPFPLFPFAAVFVCLGALFLWHQTNIAMPSHDSVRYFQQIRYVSDSWRESFRFNGQILESLYAFASPLWSFLLSLAAYLLPPMNIKNLILLNDMLFYPPFFLLFYFLNRSFFSAKAARIATLLLAVSPSVFHPGKVLLPEVFSWTLFLASLLVLRSLILHPQRFLRLYLFIFFLFLMAFTNHSVLIYPWISLILYFCIRPSEIKKPAFMILFFLMLCMPFSLPKFRSLILSPDVSGSWNLFHAVSFSMYVKMLFWQILGFINQTGGFSWMALGVLCFSWKSDEIKPLTKYSALLYLIGVMAVLAWLRPTLGRDFYVTGIRYQIPLVFLFAGLCGACLAGKPFKIITAILCLFIPILFMQSLFQSLPEKMLPGFRLTFKLSSSQTIKSSLNWDGTITLFDASNQIVSGGARTKADPFFEPHGSLSLLIIKALKKHEPQSFPFWMSCIVSDEKWPSTLSSIFLQNNIRGFILGDQNNPWIPPVIQNELNMLRINVPAYESLRNTPLFLRQSDFVLIQRDRSLEEPAVTGFLDLLEKHFAAVSDQYQLIFESKNDMEIRLYKNQFTQPDYLKKAIQVPPSIQPVPFGLWQEKQIPVALWQDQKDWFEKELLKNKVPFVKLTARDLKKALLEHRVETLILPYGPFYPEHCLQELILFYQGGGSFWFTGSAPFSNPWPPAKRANDLHQYIMRQMGMKPYVCSPSETIRFYSSPKNLQPAGSFYFNGLTVSTGSREFNCFPSAGNVFPFRIPLGHSFPLIEAEDSAGFVIGKPASFSYFHRNPYGKLFCSRIFFWGFPAYPGSLQANTEEELFPMIVNNFRYPLSLADFYPSALYVSSADESVSLNLLVRNLSEKKVSEHFVIESDGNQIMEKTGEFPPKTMTNLEILLPSVPLKKRFISFTITPKDRTIFQHLQCGLINRASPDEHKDVPYPRIQENKMTLDGDSFFLGVNYYPSSSYDRFWMTPDLSEVERDFETMKKLDIKMVRIHFIHPEWAQDFNETVCHNHLKETLPRFDVFTLVQCLLDLAQSKGLIVCLDLFSLVGKKMGDPQGWEKDPERFRDPEKIENQNRFLIRFLEATRFQSNLVIDLINEPHLTDENLSDFKNWVQEKVQIVRDKRPELLITAGLKTPFYAIKDLDFHSIHTHLIPVLPFQDKPVIIEEYWIGLPGERLSPESQKKYLFSSLTKARERGYCAFMPWCFCSPATLYETESQEETWENSLGVFQRSDGTLRWKTETENN
ncbi:MAG: cellulase family glycosylhydrolase [Candidatus Aureabacteria bacterium]|nr:cellulase family glycosylhydrolase [Candidatus Auribacterota bacterium]